jgi:rubrerythrin
MSIQWRRFIIRLALPFSWRLFPQRRAEVLQRFSVTEADSAWHFLHALSQVDQPPIRARLFNNALEEVHHASLFAEAARGEASEVLHLPTAERDTIYDPRQGLQHFYAYVYVGEKEVYDQFDAYAGAIGSRAESRIFSQLKEDEAGHMQFAEQRLAEMGVNRSGVMAQVRTIRRQRLLQSLGRGFRGVSDTMMTLVLGTIYFSLGALGLSSLRRAQRAARTAALGAGVSH